MVEIIYNRFHRQMNRQATTRKNRTVKKNQGKRESWYVVLTLCKNSNALMERNNKELQAGPLSIADTKRPPHLLPLIEELNL